MFRGLARCGVGAVLPAAGSGKRLGGRVPKPLVRLGSIPLLVRTIRQIQLCYHFDQIVVPVDPDLRGKIERMLRRYRVGGIHLTEGGRTRAESVERGIRALARSIRIVAVHDIARPFPSGDLVKRLVGVARRKGAAIAAVRATSTVKETRDGSLRIRKTLERERIFMAQTPQVARRSWLEGAYATQGRNAIGFTDESSLLEAAGRQVWIVEGPATNMKITTPDDLRIAEALLARTKR